MIDVQLSESQTQRKTTESHGKRRDKTQNLNLATEELWAKIIDMAETEELSLADWLQIIERIRRRLLLSSDILPESN